MESSNSPNFTQDQLDLIAQAQQRAAADMTGAIKSDELPSDHGRQDFPGARLSDAAEAVDEQTKDDLIVGMPDDVKAKVDAMRGRSPQRLTTSQQSGQLAARAFFNNKS